MPTQMFTDQPVFDPYGFDADGADPFVVLLADLTTPPPIDSPVLGRSNMAVVDLRADALMDTVQNTPAQNPIEADDQAPLAQASVLTQPTTSPPEKTEMVSPGITGTDPTSGRDIGTDENTDPITSSIFSMARQLIEAGNSQKIMLVLSAGQSLSFGTTLLDNFETIWSSDVDTDRAFMLDFNHQGLSARGWNSLTVDADRFDGLIPMASHVTETPAPAMITQLLAAYDDAGRIAPNMLNVGTGAVGASVLELMTSAEDLVGDQAEGLAQTDPGGLFVLARTDERFDYYVNDNGSAVYLNTHRHQPGLWDTMEAQLGFAAQGAAQSGLDIHDSVAMSFIHGQADAGLANDTYGYAWAVGRYLDMIEVALQDATGRSDLTLTVSMPQVRGDEDANVAFDQLALIASDPRVHYAGTQMEFQQLYGSNPGVDNVHLTPEGYAHLGQTVGAYLGQALLGRGETPILIETVTQDSTQCLLVQLSGIEGQIMADDHIFTDNPDLAAPDFFGFDLIDLEGAPTPAITSAQIVGGNAIRLTFDGVLTGALRLYLGLHGQDLTNAAPDFAFESYNGTSLRDSQTTGAMIPPADFDGDIFDVFEFAPTQYHDFWI